MAVGVGFEPTVPLKVQRFSRPPDSTTLAPHREGATYCQIGNIQHGEVSLIPQGPPHTVTRLCDRPRTCWGVFGRESVSFTGYDEG